VISDSFEDKHRGRAVGYFYGGQQPGGIVHRTGGRAVLRLLRLVLLPFGIGYFIGTVTGGWLVSSLDRVLPRRGRVGVPQGDQMLFAVIAFWVMVVLMLVNAAVISALYATYPRDRARVFVTLEDRRVRVLTQDS